MSDIYIVLMKKKSVFSSSLSPSSPSLGVIISDVEMDILCCLDCCRHGPRSTRCLLPRPGHSNESRVRETHHAIPSRRGQS